MMPTPSAGGDRYTLLLTGVPGVGKTTVIRRVAAGLSGWRVRGFTTEEIRVGGRRAGFGLETLDGQSATLAHVDLVSPHRVGGYGVDVAMVDRIAASALVLDPATRVYLIDEIGKMECLSPRFVAAVSALLDAHKLLVATIALRGGGLIEAVKKRPEVEVWAVTRENRDGLPAKVVAWLGERVEA
jgi:nucleoside-triphosphatase